MHAQFLTRSQAARCAGPQYTLPRAGIYLRMREHLFAFACDQRKPVLAHVLSLGGPGSPREAADLFALARMYVPGAVAQWPSSWPAPIGGRTKKKRRKVSPEERLRRKLRDLPPEVALHAISYIEYVTDPDWGVSMFGEMDDIYSDFEMMVTAEREGMVGGKEPIPELALMGYFARDPLRIPWMVFRSFLSFPTDTPFYVIAGQVVSVREFVATGSGALSFSVAARMHHAMETRGLRFHSLERLEVVLSEYSYRKGRMELGGALARVLRGWTPELRDVGAFGVAFPQSLQPVTVRALKSVQLSACTDPYGMVVEGATNAIFDEGTALQHIASDTLENLVVSSWTWQHVEELRLTVQCPLLDTVLLTNLNAQAGDEDAIADLTACTSLRRLALGKCDVHLRLPPQRLQRFVHDTHDMVQYRTFGFLTMLRVNADVVKISHFIGTLDVTGGYVMLDACASVIEKGNLDRTNRVNADVVDIDSMYTNVGDEWATNTQEITDLLVSASVGVYVTFMDLDEDQNALLSVTAPVIVTDDEHVDAPPFRYQTKRLVPRTQSMDVLPDEPVQEMVLGEWMAWEN